MKITVLVFLFFFISSRCYAQIDVENCILEHQTCTSSCLEGHSDASKASCVAKCALSEAKCVGHVGIKKSEPFLRKKAEELENFLNDFLGGILPEQDRETPPPLKKEGSTDT